MPVAPTKRVLAVIMAGGSGTRSNADKRQIIRALANNPEGAWFDGTAASMQGRNLTPFGG